LGLRQGDDSKNSQRLAKNDSGSIPLVEDAASMTQVNYKKITINPCYAVQISNKKSSSTLMQSDFLQGSSNL
jgi:hypothetical protein